MAYVRKHVHFPGSKKPIERAVLATTKSDKSLMREAALQIIEAFAKSPIHNGITANIVCMRPDIATLRLKHENAQGQIHVRLLLGKDDSGRSRIMADAGTHGILPLEICKEESSYRLELRVAGQSINLNEHTGLTDFTNQCAGAFGMLLRQEYRQRKARQQEKLKAQVKALREEMRVMKIGEILSALQAAHYKATNAEEDEITATPEETSSEASPKAAPEPV